MSAQKMHADEIDTDASMVAALLAAQFPAWTDLAIRRVESSGTDNAMYRLGDDMVARLPRTLDASWQVDKEHRWLPQLAPHLPLAIPALLGEGAPGDGYPWRWSIYRWLEGEDATTAAIDDRRRAATQLGEFVSALHRIDAIDGPPPGDHNFWRGDGLTDRDPDVREALAALDGIVDVDASAAAWEVALAAPPWDGPPVWIHGDLYPGNLLVHDGELSAVIDFGGLGVGDPACDVMAAWSFLSEETRADFRAALPTDDATWARGRGWALSMALIGLPYYQDTNPIWSNTARRTIRDVLEDQG